MSLGYFRTTPLTIKRYCRRIKVCCRVLSLCCPCSDVGVKEELSDVDDTASGTDWLMLNSQQYLMHCLQHRKKRQSTASFKKMYFSTVLAFLYEFLIVFLLL